MVQSEHEPMFQANGLDGATGGYLLPPLSADQLADVARGETIDTPEVRELQWWHQLRTEASYGVAEGIDPNHLDEAGWGLIASENLEQAVLDALEPLRKLRKEQATVGGHEDFYQEFVGKRAYRNGESKQQFLGRLGVGPGPANPASGVPYYLLIVGHPDTIPFSFQYQLDVAYAVGRICFDTAEEYAAYARAVHAAEATTTQQAVPPRITLWGPTNPDDPATQLSTEGLVVPLTAALKARSPKWTVEAHVGAAATKPQLVDLLTQGNAPDVVFTASHGVGFPLGHDRQESDNGALVCQEWPGPRAGKGALTDDVYLSGADIVGDSPVHGSVVCSFACFGAGTPHMDDFSRRAFKDPTNIAERSFVARLPQRLLAHEDGGVLAFVGHVDLAWGCSFQWKGHPQLEVFRGALSNLLDGYRVGAAMEYFNQRYAELSADLTSELDEIRNSGKIPDDFELATLWTANNDARNYAIVGDPAVRARRE
jgi:hypothetical protein